MIIGIVGRKQSGKDTVAKILQYLTDEATIENKDKYPLSFNEYIENESIHNSGKWEIKRFADKLKDIVCLLTGCTRLELESEEFKISLLPKEWQNLKDYTEYSWLNYSHVLSYRLALQYIGTNLFRNQFHPDTWVNATMTDYKPTIGLKYPNWIIPDVRFKNEVEAIKSKSGITIKLVRDTTQDPCDYCGKTLREQLKGCNELRCYRQHLKDNHLSEISVDNLKCDYIIHNDGSIEDLINKVNLIVKDIL